MSGFSSLQNHVKKPDPTDTRYVIKREIDLGPSDELFNGVKGRRLRRVEVYGVRINHVNDASSPLRPYVNAMDIQEILICADAFDLAAPLIVPQSKVHLVARRLSAVGGEIATSAQPMSQPTDPGAAAQQGSNGGDVTILCAELSGGFRIRAIGAPGQSLARKRTRSDQVPLIPCEFNQPEAGVPILLRFPEHASVGKLGPLMKPPMEHHTHWMSWPSLLEGRNAAELRSWNGRIAYIRAEFDPEVRKHSKGWPDNNYWELGTQQGPWEDDGNAYGKPARGGDGGSLRTSSKALLNAVHLWAPEGWQSQAAEEPAQSPDWVVHLFLKLQSGSLGGKQHGTRSARAEIKKKTPPQLPVCEEAGTPGAKALLPASPPATTPEVLDLAVRYAKDLYLAGYPEDARAVLRSLDFKSLNDPHARSLAIEAAALLDRLDKNLDFYGNPLSWVPLLSVDTNLAVFQAEIDRSLDLLYLAHVLEARWSRYEEQVKIIESAEKHTRELADEASRKRAAVWAKIGRLSGDLEDMKKRSEKFKEDLEKLQKELLEKAKTEVERQQAWQAVASLFKYLSAAAAAIPVGAPYSTMASKTLDMVSDIAVNASAGSITWNDTLVNAFETAQGAFKTGLEDETFAKKLLASVRSPDKEIDEAKKKIRELDDRLSTLKAQDNPEKERLKRERSAFQKTVKESEGARDEAIETFNASLEGLAGLFKVTNTEIKKLMVSAEEADKKIAEELKKLEAGSEKFQELKKSLDELTVRRAEMATTLLGLETEVGKLAASVTNNVLNLDTLFREKGKKIELLSPRISQVAGRLRQQAEEGLNKYQYYLKKSYEYNFLEPAQYDFGAAALQAQIVKYLQEGSDTRELSRERVQSLRALYQEGLGKLGGRIVDSLQNSYGRYWTTLTLKLDGEALSALGRLGSYTVDLDTRLPAKSEDVRIRDVSIDKLVLRPGANARDLQLRIWHSGTSRLQRGGNRYQFVSTARRMWGVAYVPSTGKWTAIEPADKVDAQLIQRLFNSPSAGDRINELGRYNPAFSGPLDLEILAGGDSTETPITELSLKIEYEFRPLR
jgi:hypothetical protein